MIVRIIPNVNHVTFYNPYEKDHISLPKYSSPDLVNFSLGETLSDVALYYQPLPNPIFAAVNLGISFVILVLGEYINARVLQFVKRETGLVMDVLMRYIFVVHEEKVICFGKDKAKSIRIV